MCLSWRPAQALKGCKVSRLFLAIQASQVQRPHHRPKEFSRLPRPSGPSLDVPGTHLVPQPLEPPRLELGALGWSVWTVWGHEGEQASMQEAQQGPRRLASPHCLDLHGFSGLFCSNYGP